MISSEKKKFTLRLKSSGKINVFLLICTFMCGQTDFDNVRREKQGKVLQKSGGFDVQKQQ